MDEITMDRLAKVYIKIRGRLSELLREYEAAEEVLKKQQKEIADEMKNRLRALGVTSAGTTEGTVTLKTTSRFYAKDWEAMHNFIHEHDAAFLLEKRIAQSNMSEFLEKNPGVVPPGLDTVSEITVSVTKPRK